MENETDTDNLGGESLSIDQAAAAFVKATTTEEVQTDHPETEDENEASETTDDELQASDEGEGEETDGETESEEDPEQDEDSEPESDQGRFVADNAKVRLADGTVTTIHELKRGFLREADYTRKRQEDAALSKETAAERERLKASEEQLNKDRELAISVLKAVIPPPPDPEKANPRSEKYDPAGYQAEMVAHQQWAQYLTQLETDQQRAEQERHAKVQEESKGKIEKEWSTALEKLPELKDPKKLESFGRDTLKYGAEAGYTPQELANIHHDHRQLVVMKGYIQWRKLQESKASVQKKVEGRPPVQKGGKRLNPSEHKSRAASDAINRLKESGSHDDAVAAYIASLNR